ncbi:hypothetical protein GGS23DRAFT_590597 [Durotheca rogersii]|uniref:uncharacterized protein n=1 Tax=Durotheca rogersii TaxID=419775 RepID=UPI00221F4298|nr:uncharacterized protein GGS23DRAFT_590597 [Durotheca rogersii]KAI5854488.1 hypothetical protein GGS23DRAFT_590597 [Durotheca rogersii]
MKMEIFGNALVVGGASGIGRATAILLAKDGAAGVMVADLAISAARDVVAECRAVATNARFHAEAVEVDVTQEDSVRHALGQMVRIFGRIDYCVNCAGIGVEQAVDIADTSSDAFRRFLDVNATGTFLVTREASIVMRSQKLLPASPTSPGRGPTRGSIVNLGSGSSLIASPGILPYTTSKHAVLGLTKNSALDNAAYGIRVNCVCPSWTDTPMVQAAINGTEDLAKLIAAAVPIGRMALPEEVADTVVFLCSPRSSYMTGSSLVVDGGTTLTALR